jgi:DUF1680 family protein
MNLRPLALLLLSASPAFAQAGSVTTTPSGSPGGKALPHLQEVPFPQVKIDDRFFAPRRATNSRVTLRHALKQLEDTGTLANFDLAAQGRREGFKGYVFQDSDAYKALEAVACALAEHPDSALEKSFDAVVERIAKAQQPDGYLDTWYLVNAPGKRFVNLRDDHELYCAGHLFEAAVAHFTATGKRTLLDIARKYADLLVRTFGDGDDHRPGYCGHPEVELALVKLARATGRQQYLDLARYFVLHRGSHFFAAEHKTDQKEYDGTYWLDQTPVCDLQAIAGHAVRAAYLMSGAVDVAAATGDDALLRMTRRVWRNTIGRNVFVTGGIGPSASNEGFTRDYDLPTFTAYQESCASIALVMWAHRLNLLTGDVQYADAVETALYNAIPAGVQLDGTRFFYVNPLASRGDHHRREWFGCACCPPNLARTFAALGSYAYATGVDSLWINLYLQGSVEAEVQKQPFALTVRTDYPWEGEIDLAVAKAPAAEAELRLRIPGWCSAAKVTCNGESVLDGKGLAGVYVGIRRQWHVDDKVHVSLDMPVRAIEADPRADNLRGMVAFARGPVVYCAEQQDQQAAVEQIVAPPGSTLVPQRRDDLLGGVVVLAGEMLDGGDRNWTGRLLYRSQTPAPRTPVLLVPYAVWDNRKAGAMAVWLPQAPHVPRLGGPERTAKIEISFKNWNCDPEGLRDGGEPARSGDTPARSCHWWDHLGGTEWVQYVWDAPQRLAGCRIYWFDDTGHGACRLPKSARLLWRDGDEWKPVQLAGALPIAIDRWCDVRFAPVATKALRLEVQQQDGWASGVLEWRVEEADEDR